jgi:hypothetical protein
VRALRILLRAPHPRLLHVVYMKSFEHGLSPPYLQMPVSKAPIREQVLAGPIDRMGILRVRHVRSIHSLARTALQVSACKAYAIYQGASPSPVLVVVIPPLTYCTTS